MKQVRIGVIGVTGRGGLWKHWHKPEGKSVVAGGADPVISKDFVDMLLTGKEPVSTPEAGRMSVATGCAATESLRNGGKVMDIPTMPDLA